MRVHVLQHVPFEGLGSIEPWLAQRGTEIRYTRFFERDPLPDLDAVDLLVAMGGPMSVNDEAQFSWLEQRSAPSAKRSKERFASPESAWVRNSSPARSGRGSIRTPSRKSAGCRSRASTGPKKRSVFRRNAPCFTGTAKRSIFLEARCGSPGAPDVRIRRSSWPGHVIGLQFDLETTAAVAHGMVENCGEELVAGSYVQSATEILDVPAARYQAINGLMSDVLTYLVDRRAAPQAQPSAAELQVGGR